MQDNSSSQSSSSQNGGQAGPVSTGFGAWVQPAQQQPMVQPMAQPLQQPMVQPVQQPVAQPVTQPLQAPPQQTFVAPIAPEYQAVPASYPAQVQPSTAGGSAFGDDDDTVFPITTINADDEILPPGADPNYRFGEALATFTTTLRLAPNAELSFDQDYFLALLAGSISLSVEEKRRVIDSVSRLRQSQIDELIRIFEDEREKFLEMSVKHAAHLKKLEAKYQSEWKSIEAIYAEMNKANEEQQAVDDIKAKLGL